uniref:Putative storage protein n=1 Tax=Eragrostis tef TaxID=110835 RepID=A0A173G7S7_ERATE|nr:putative storage protein [Eragrostis tef]
MASIKMFAMFAIIALSCSAATATVFPQVIPPTAAWATMSHPCLQYCMLQQPFAMAGSRFTSIIMQQPLASFLQQQQAFPIVSSPATTWLQQQCNCAVVSPMIHQQQIAAQMLYLFNPMAAAMPLPYLTNPIIDTIQLPYLTNPMAVALQLPYLYNPMASTMQLSSIFNPISRAMQLSPMFNPFAMAGPSTYFQSCAAGACF